jgi:hypothetical protein
MAETPIRSAFRKERTSVYPDTPYDLPRKDSV